MSPSNNRSDTDKSFSEENPFIIFRRYADEQVANLLQSFIGLPSAIASQSHNQRWQPYDDEIQRRRMERRDTSLEEQERRQIVNQIEEAFRETLQNDAATQTRPDDEETFIPVKTFRRQDPYVQDEDDVSRCPYRPSEQSSPAIANPYESFFPWPFNYMLFSSYSPLKLERQEHFREHGDRWRNAFEDLLSMDEENGPSDQSELTSEGTESSPLRPQGSGIESHLAKLLRVNTQHNRYLKKAEELAFREPQNDANEESMTELDYYERLLEQQRTDREKHSSALLNISKPMSVPDVGPSKGTGEVGKKLGIISTLTTTERVSLPDGTVHTKVVLKQRFADGREESSETVHTAQGGPQPESKASSLSGFARDSQEPSLAPTNTGKQNNEKKGWFWS